MRWSALGSRSQWRGRPASTIVTPSASSSRYQLTYAWGTRRTPSATEGWMAASAVVDMAPRYPPRAAGMGRGSGRVLDRPQHLGGRPRGDRARRQVRRHDGVRPDHAALADGHATRDDHVGAAPHVVAHPGRPLGGEALPG